MQWKLLLFVLLLLLIPGIFFFLSRAKQESLPRQSLVKQSPGPNLASILITASPSAAITLVDAKGRSVGTSFVQQGIRPPGLPSGTPSPMGDLREFVMQEPQDGAYDATITLAERGEIVFYLYNTVGEVSVERVTQQTGTSHYRIDFVAQGKSQFRKQ